MATISNVAGGELITSAWGNAVADELNGNTVKRTGAQTMSGSLTAPSLTASTGNIVTSAGNVTAPAGQVVAGNTPSDVAVGTLLRSDGVISGTVNDPTSLSTPSLVLQRTGTSAGVGGAYIDFRRLAGGTRIGSVTIVAGPGVAYNTTSDRRMKDIIGEVVDPVDRLLDLHPRRLQWKAEPQADEFDGFIADEVATVVPAAVTGDPDAVDDNGNIAPQQLDVSRLVPLLVAAVQELAGRVVELEAARGGAT
jgi:hypothetical protein